MIPIGAKITGNKGKEEREREREKKRTVATVFSLYIDGIATMIGKRPETPFER